MLKIGVLTLFPEMFNALRYGVSARALDKTLHLSFYNPRDYTEDRMVDDRPYGGGPGMVMKLAPLAQALRAAQKTLGKGKVIHLTPQGKPITQQKLQAHLNASVLYLVAGRYEGIDERFVELYVEEEWSVGDYIVSGGELPAMIVIDALARLLPGTLHHPASGIEDSFYDGLLEAPCYTRPEVVEGKKVPEVLLSGDHAKINRWRFEQSLKRTWQKRPDLVKRRDLTEKEREILSHLLGEHNE